MDSKPSLAAAREKKRATGERGIRFTFLEESRCDRGLWRWEWWAWFAATAAATAAVAVPAATSAAAAAAGLPSSTEPRARLPRPSPPPPVAPASAPVVALRQIGLPPVNDRSGVTLNFGARPFQA